MKELIKYLKQLPPDLKIMMASDGEENDHAVVYGIRVDIWDTRISEIWDGDHVKEDSRTGELHLLEPNTEFCVVMVPAR